MKFPSPSVLKHFSSGRCEAPDNTHADKAFQPHVLPPPELNSLSIFLLVKTNRLEIPGRMRQPLLCPTPIFVLACHCESFVEGNTVLIIV
jgi:hypothetical protein